MSESSTTSTEGVYEGGVMLNKPPIDKPGALLLARRCLGVKLPIKRYWYDKFCSSEQMMLWEAPKEMGGENLLPIDVGDEKYHSSGFGSASERIVKMFEADGRITTTGERKLVEILNKNNASGHLKGMHMSIAWTMRELYELSGFDQADIIDRVLDVVDVFVQVEDGEMAEDRPTTSMEEALGDLVEQTKKCSYAPFTPGRYMRDMWELGMPVEEIVAKVGYWIDGWKAARAEVERAKADYAKLDKAPLIFTVGGVKCLKLETDDRVLTKVAGHDRSIGIRVVKNPSTGLAAIIGRGGKTNLSDLAAWLQKEEPGLWYYHKAAETLINGGVQYTETAPTAYSLEHLCALLENFPPG